MEQQTLYYVLIILVALSTILPVLTSYINRKRQQKALEEQLEKRQRYLSTLQAGDEVILFSGLHGKIIKLTDSLVELQIAEGVLVYVEKSRLWEKPKNYFYEVVLLSCLRKEAVAGLKLYPWDIVLPRIKGKETPMGFLSVKASSITASGNIRWVSAPPLSRCLSWEQGLQPINCQVQKQLVHKAVS